MSSLAKLWEKEKRIRKRFRVHGSFLQFPAVAAKDGEEDSPPKENPINTASLQMNATAVRVMLSKLRVLSGKQVPVADVQIQVP